jgi:hypothetical protein
MAAVALVPHPAHSGTDTHDQARARADQTRPGADLLLFANGTARALGRQGSLSSLLFGAARPIRSVTAPYFQDRTPRPWAKSNVINAKPVGALENDGFLSIAEVPTSERIAISGFVASGDTLYLGFADTIQRVPLSMAVPFATDAVVPEPTVIARDQPAAGQFAADANNVYWRTSDCRIMRLAK